jgi:hypothetical protein
VGGIATAPAEEAEVTKKTEKQRVGKAGRKKRPRLEKESIKDLDVSKGHEGEALKGGSQAPQRGYTDSCWCSI